jgi:hypothetical protein
MSDKTIKKFHVTETENGYTIEIEGDKDLIRDMIFSRIGMQRFGPARHRHGHEHGREHHKAFKRGHHRGRRFGRHAEPEYELGPWWDANPGEASEDIENA